MSTWAHLRAIVIAPRWHIWPIIWRSLVDVAHWSCHDGGLRLYVPAGRARAGQMPLFSPAIIRTEPIADTVHKFDRPKPATFLQITHILRREGEHGCELFLRQPVSLASVQHHFHKRRHVS